MSRPKCVQCGKVYGQRQTITETVRWDTPAERVKGPRGEMGYVQSKDIAPAPSYRGNGIVVGHTRPYVSADNGRAVMQRYVWDGETWSGGYEPFCTLRCALAYARKAIAKAEGAS